MQPSCSMPRPVTGSRFSFPATRWSYKVGILPRSSAHSQFLRCLIFTFMCVRLPATAASGDVQAYQIRTAATSAITPGVVMATSPALGAGGVTEEVTRKREVRLMKNRWGRLGAPAAFEQLKFCQISDKRDSQASLVFLAGRQLVSVAGRRRNMSSVWRIASQCWRTRTRPSSKNSKPSKTCTATNLSSR